MPSTAVPAEESGDRKMTPVVLREELRPPSYGTLYSEQASRSFYTKYSDYERRVLELANMGGAVMYPVVSMAQLVPTHLHHVFARVFHDKNAITSLQLAAAIKKTCRACGGR